MEMMIAIGLFMIIMVIATNIFLQAVSNQARANSSKNLQESLQYALAIMSNETAGAQKDPTRCAGSCPSSKDYFCVLNDNTKLIFVNALGECVSYDLDLDTNNLLRLKVIKSSEAINLDGYLTSVDVIFKSAQDVKFFNYFDNNANYPLARLTMILNGQSVNKEGSIEPMLLQTTVGVYPNQ